MITLNSFYFFFTVNTSLNLTDLLSRGAWYPLMSGPIFVYNETDCFVNNGKVINQYEFSSPHIFVYEIDRVIEIVKEHFNPWEFVRQPHMYGYDNLNLVAFFESFKPFPRLVFMYSHCPNCTFFIPNNTQEILMEQVLLAHIVFNKLLYTRRMDQNKEYQTTANTDELAVKLSKDERETSNQIFINAYSSGTSIHYKPGFTHSRILYSNIPTSSGLIHVIDKPFVLVNITLQDYLNGDEFETLRHFKHFIDQFPSLQYLIESSDPEKPVTVFAFTNEAYNLVSDDIVFKSDNEYMLEDILKIHFVDNSTIESKHVPRLGQDYSFPNDSKENLLMFLDNDQFFVKTEEVTAKVIVKDIITNNGIIHIIDRVLGIAISSFLDRLSNDPLLCKTHTFIQASNWLIDNYYLSKKYYTFFAPSNQAWHKLMRSNPFYYMRLMMGSYPSLSKKVSVHLILK
jgi:fasciclin-1